MKKLVVFMVFALSAGLFDAYIANRRICESFFYDGYDIYIGGPIPTKGSYFEFGIEFGYTWKNKQDKIIHNQ